MHKIYNWILRKSKHPMAAWYLGIISFAESSISFIPPDPLMIPMIVADKTRAWKLAFLTTWTSVLGGIVGYAIGFYLFERLGLPILKTYGLLDKLAGFQDFFHKWGFWAIIIKAFLPLPFKLVTITAGALKFNIWNFILASTFSRGIRFFLEAGLVYKYGEEMNKVLQAHMLKIACLFLGLLVGGFFLVKLL